MTTQTINLDIAAQAIIAHSLTTIERMNSALAYGAAPGDPTAVIAHAVDAIRAELNRTAS